MDNFLLCQFVINEFNGLSKISSKDKDQFIEQFRLSLEETKGIFGVVYIFRTEKPLPRLKGKSNILYIGETKYDVWSRYNVKKDVNIFWSVYSYVVENYGAITVDVYESSNHKVTEKFFLSRYYDSHKELPPINSKG